MDIDEISSILETVQGRFFYNNWKVLLNSFAEGHGYSQLAAAVEKIVSSE